MQKTKIEWCDYSINPVKGLCPMACEFCYARRMYKRFKWNPEIRFDESGFVSPLVLPHKKIFVGSTMELFGEWIKEEWLERIFQHCVENSDLTYIFLTKRHENLIKWSPFPDNCWIGVSVSNQDMFDEAIHNLDDVEAKIRFISFEPLLSEIKDLCDNRYMGNWLKDYIDWAIIGQKTPVSKSNMPKIEWIRDIVEAADRANIPVFLKNNLSTLKFHYPEDMNLFKSQFKLELRQEFPQVTK